MAAGGALLAGDVDLLADEAKLKRSWEKSAQGRHALRLRDKLAEKAAERRTEAAEKAADARVEAVEARVAAAGAELPQLQGELKKLREASAAAQKATNKAKEKAEAHLATLEERWTLELREAPPIGSAGKGGQVYFCVALFLCW